MKLFIKSALEFSDQSSAQFSIPACTRNHPQSSFPVQVSTSYISTLNLPYKSHRISTTKPPQARYFHRLYTTQTFYSPWIKKISKTPFHVNFNHNIPTNAKMPFPEYTSVYFYILPTYKILKWDSLNNTKYQKRK